MSVTATLPESPPSLGKTVFSSIWARYRSDAAFFFVQIRHPSGSGDVLVQITPVPEPETYAMMLAGLGLLGLAVRRRMAG